MTVADTSARILRLLSLLAARVEWSGADLADRVGVSARTLRRDVDTLRELGYPVEAIKGPGGGYRLGPGAKLPPLVLDDDQAIAIALALQTAPATVTGIEDAVTRALTTLRRVMPARSRAASEAFDVTNLRNYWEFSAPPVDVETLQAVGAAIRRSRVLRVDVLPVTEGTPRVTTGGADGQSPGAGTDRSRTRADAAAVAAGPALGSTAPPDAGPPARIEPPLEVEPHHLVVWAGRWYLIARDRRLLTWQTLRVDRLRPRSPEGALFTPQPLTSDDITRLVVQNPDRGDTPGQWQCVGWASLPLPAGVVARWAPGGSVVEALGSDRCRLTIGGWSWVGVAGLFITFDAELDDVGPAELVRAFGDIRRRLPGAG